MTPDGSGGIIDIPGNHSMDETVEKLKGILRAKRVTLFALVNHSGETEKAGMKMAPTKLLIFSNPKVGKPLILAAPRSAIDLPLKILVWEDGSGKDLGNLQQPNLFAEAAQSARGVAAKHSSSRSVGGKSG